MSETDPIEQLQHNKYEATVPVDLSVFDDLEAVRKAIVDTVARSIIADVDILDEENHEAVAERVEFDEEALGDAFADDEVGIASVETVTTMMLLDEEDDQ